MHPCAEAGRCHAAVLHMEYNLPHHTNPRMSPELIPSHTMDLPSRVWMSGLVFLHQTNQKISQHNALPNYNHCLQFPALTSPRGGCVGNVPQWAPLLRQDPSSFSSNFTFSSAYNIIHSIPEVLRPDIKCTTGLSEVQQVAMSHVCSIMCLKSRFIQTVGELS